MTDNQDTIDPATGEPVPAVVFKDGTRREGIAHVNVCEDGGWTLTVTFECDAVRYADHAEYAGVCYRPDGPPIGAGKHRWSQGFEGRGTPPALPEGEIVR